MKKDRRPVCFCCFCVSTFSLFQNSPFAFFPCLKVGLLDDKQRNLCSWNKYPPLLLWQGCWNINIWKDNWQEWELKFLPLIAYIVRQVKNKSSHFHYRFDSTPPLIPLLLFVRIVHMNVCLCVLRGGSQAARSHTCSARLASFMFYYDTPVLKWGCSHQIFKLGDKERRRKVFIPGSGLIPATAPTGSGKLLPVHPTSPRPTPSTLSASTLLHSG